MSHPIIKHLIKNKEKRIAYNREYCTSVEIIDEKIYLHSGIPSNTDFLEDESIEEITADDALEYLKTYYLDKCDRFGYEKPELEEDWDAFLEKYWEY